MEWAHTAQVFGSTLESLRLSQAQAQQDAAAGLDASAAAGFLSSFYAGAQQLASADGDSGEERADAALHRTARSHIDLTKKGGWRHRFVHWFIDGHTTDKENETSYYELLHAPGRASLEYDPLALDYSGVYWGLSYVQREALAAHGMDLSRLPPLPQCVNKEQLNLQFLMDHPLIDRSFTGSKLRSLRQLLVAIPDDTQLVTRAAAWVYFEKLVRMNKVNKENRRLVFGACVSLSTKFHEDKRSASSVLASVASTFSCDVAPRDIASKEFHVFAALSFQLRVSELELLPHLMMLENADRNGAAHAASQQLHVSIEIL